MPESTVDIYLNTDIVPKANNVNNVSSIENSTMLKITEETLPFRGVLPRWEHPR
jgi:hypothetical protein